MGMLLGEIALIALGLYAGAAIVFGLWVGVAEYSTAFAAGMRTEPKRAPRITKPVKRRQFFAPQANAYRLYPYDRGWRVMRAIGHAVFPAASRKGSKWLRVAGDLFANGSAAGDFWLASGQYILGGVLGIIGIELYVWTMLLIIIFWEVQLVILALWALLVAILVALYQIPTNLFVLIKRLRFHCPICYQAMLTATHMCPCGRTHSRLWPSNYGIFTHQCVCGKHLPTIDIFGKAALQRICAAPLCGYPLPSFIGRTRVCHYAMVGGPSTGKTNFITVAVYAFLEKQIKALQGEGYSVSFPLEQQYQQFMGFINSLNHGHDLPQTTSETPFAILLMLKSPHRATPQLVYLYDAAGEVFYDARRARKQRYFEHLDGIIFMVDPFTAPGYADAHATEIQAQQGQIRPGDPKVDEVFARMIELLRPFQWSFWRRTMKIPIAVTISKVDALHLEEEIGLPATTALMTANPQLTQDDALSQLAIHFLETYGLKNFVLNVNRTFVRLKFFSCSALHRFPNHTEIAPLRITLPLLWIMKTANKIEPIPRRR